MVAIIIYLFVIVLYCLAPLPVQFVLLLINTVTPDPIPFLDEAIMYASFIKKLARLLDILEFVENHPIISGIIGIGLCAGIVYVVKLIFNI